MIGFNITAELAKNKIPLWVQKNPDTFETDYIYEVSVYAKTVIEGIETKDLMIKEHEVKVILTEDFKDQFPEGIGHNPSSDFKDYGSFVDLIMISFDKSKSRSNGLARWEIPVEMRYKNSFEPPKKSIVIQEYLLQNKEITILKGGKELFKGLVK